MRQQLGRRKIQKLRKQTGLPVVSALVRGGTNHRIDMTLEDGTVVHLFRDGTIERDAPNA